MNRHAVNRMKGKEKHQLCQTTMKHGQQTGKQRRKTEREDVWEANGERAEREKQKEKQNTGELVGSIWLQEQRGAVSWWLQFGLSGTCD